MTSNPKPIPVTAATDLLSLLDAAAKGSVLLARNRELFRLMREEDDMAYEPDAERVRETLAATAGTWADVDVDAMIADVREARRAGSRPSEQPCCICMMPDGSFRRSRIGNQQARQGAAAGTKASSQRERSAAIKAETACIRRSDTLRPFAGR